MNEESQRTPGTLQEAVVLFRADESVAEHAEPLPLPLRVEDLRGADLRGRDLTGIRGLLPEHLAGTVLTGAKLPDEIAKFPALAQIKEISADARKIFIGLLAACVYSWLVIGTTRDVDLILNTATSPLPIINTPIPIANFYVVGAALLAAVYCYLHFYLQRLWRTLAALPAVFPDGVAVDDKTDPWLLTNLVRADFAHLRANAPPLARLENLLTIVLAWGLVPLTLAALWARYLPARYWLGTTLLVALIGVTALFGRHSYRLARATLRNEALLAENTLDDGRGVLGRAVDETRRIRPDALTVCLTLILSVCSISAIRDNPRDDYTWVAKFLNLSGVRTYANLLNVDVSGRPEGWTGSEWHTIRQIDLRNRHLAFAVARGAFLAKADLSGTNLRDADLRGAQLHQAILRNADLRGADLRGARLQLVDFRDADLRGANLEGAQLRGAGFIRARLQGANLSHAHFHGAYLRDAKLQGAVLKGAQLQGAVLASAGLQGADLTESRLEGADLGKAALWRAIVDGAVWDAADVRGTHLLPFGDAGTLVADVTAAISNGGRRKEATERLVAAFEGEDRASRPDFPDLWRVLPNVMFDENDPVPEPFDWGPRTWTQEEYERTLGEMLGNLGCHDDQPPAQTRGLAWRAIQSGQRERLYAQRLAARLTGDDCPPAAGLPEDIRRQLESLAARDDNKVAATPEMLPSDPAE